MKGCARSMLIALSVVQTVAVANAGERTALTNPSVAVSGASSGQGVIRGAQPNISPTLDRVAYAVDGAESSHGEDLTMWRPDPSGPQGPMQVSGPAAADVGGGDRFDSTENRAIGRAYLASYIGGTKTGQMRLPPTIGAWATWIVGSRLGAPQTNS